MNKMLTSKEIETKLRALKPLLYRDFFVRRIGYFGSFSRNEETTDSDVDILVEFEKPLGWEFFDLQDLLEEKLNRKVDLVSSKAIKEQLKDIIFSQVKFV